MTTDEEGFTAVRPEKAAKPTDCRPALETSMLDCRPALTVKSGAFERLQEEEEDDEEEQVPGFQSQASLYEGKERMQKGHAGKERMKEVPPPPQPEKGSRRVKGSKESRRRYVNPFDAKMKNVSSQP